MDRRKSQRLVPSARYNKPLWCKCRGLALHLLSGAEGGYLIPERGAMEER